MELEEAKRILNSDILLKIQAKVGLSVRIAVETVLEELENK